MLDAVIRDALKIWRGCAPVLAAFVLLPIWRRGMLPIWRGCVRKLTACDKALDRLHNRLAGNS
jgi:hypothetical protein